MKAEKIIKEKKEKPKKLVLLDSHAIIHRAYHALPDFSSSKGEPTGALYGLSTMLMNILKTFHPDYVVATFDLPGPTYRHEAFKDYKAGRKKGDDALMVQLNRAKDVFEALNIPIYSLPGFEADDMLGTIVEELKDNKEVDIIIASGDMDTMQLIDDKHVQVYTLKKGIKDTILYDEKAVKARFGFDPIYLPDYKGLRGDPSDNIPGVRGIGEKTGGTLITEYHTIENLYKALKKDKEKVRKTTGLSERFVELLLANEEEALFSKTLATIRRDAPINFKMPEKTFKETLDFAKVAKLFDELEFKSLGDRLKFVMTGEQDIPRQARDNAIALKDIGYDPKLAEENMVLRFLVDSNISSPDTDEILRFTKTETLKEANEVLLKEIEKRNLNVVWEKIEKPLIPVLHDMKKIGIKLDIPYVNKLSEQYHAELDLIEKQIYTHAKHEFNINSPKQLGEILFTEMGLKAKRQKKTASGALSTKESELVKMRDLHPIIDLVLEHRELQKLLSTYIDVLPTLADEGDRVHTSLIQYGAATGRMSSTNPNLQNIPVKSEKGRAIRKAFIVEKGFDMVAIDYSQMELRIAAFLSGDKKLIEVFKNGEDVHTAVASQVFKIDPKDVDKEMRRKAKVINFGILYGMGVSALKENLGGTREEAQIFYNTYFETFTGLAEYLEKVKAETARKGYTETYFGRRRYIEGMNASLGFIRSIAERAAINAPIQGTEADVIKWAMVKIADWVKEEKLEDEVRMLLQVHDELLFEIKEGKAEEYVPKIRKIMESIIDPKEVYDITLSTEASVGGHWGNLEKMLKKI
jgi:DNA polymerase-1